MPLSPDGRSTRADAVSFDASVISGWDSSQAFGNRRAAYWTAETPGEPFSTYAETLMGAPWYPPNSVNGPGEVLAMTDDGLFMGGDTHLGGEVQYPGGIHWSAAEGFTEIEALTDNWGAWPQAMTPDGTVIVGLTGSYQSPVRYATIWTKDTGTVLLEERLNQLGANIGDFTYLGFARGITADGKTIIGCTPGQGAWVITRPSPPDEGVPERAGTGTLVEEDGVPFHLPVIPAPSRRPQPEIKTIEKSVPKNNTGAIEFGSN